MPLVTTLQFVSEWCFNLPLAPHLPQPPIRQLPDTIRDIVGLE